MVERACLENKYTRKGIEGSNPSASANFQNSDFGGIHYTKSELFLTKIQIANFDAPPRRRSLTLATPHKSFLHLLFRWRRKAPPIKKSVKLEKVRFWCPREESNPYYKIRNLVSYPLNDEGVSEHSDKVR